MNFRYSEIKMAFDFVSSGLQGENIAYVSKEDGEIYYYSVTLGLDETRGHDVHSSCFIAVPHRNSLDIDRELAFDFVDEHLPEHYTAVRDYFADEETAESRFRNVLEANGLLEEWNKYREATIEKFLREWCSQRNIELEKEK
ncbi:MAG: hypothetical protein MI685_07020 [Chlorobiales bacterium]|nr:hypothetical protein [Chlorobiales bacterium]